MDVKIILWLIGFGWNEICVIVCGRVSEQKIIRTAADFGTLHICGIWTLCVLEQIEAIGKGK